MEALRQAGGDMDTALDIIEAIVLADPLAPAPAAAAAAPAAAMAVGSEEALLGPNPAFARTLQRTAVNANGMGRPPLPRGPLGVSAPPSHPSSRRVSLGEAGARELQPWRCPALSPFSPRLPPLGPGERFRDSYELVLKIDNREQYHGGRGHQEA